MKKSISKVIMLTFAVVLMFSTLGLTTAYAADKTIVLDSGAVSVSPSATPGVVNVLQGGKTVTTLSAATNDILVLNGALPVNNTAVPITIVAGTNVSIRFTNAVNITAPVGLPVIAIPLGSTVNLAAPLGATLTGGNSGIVAGVTKTASPAVSGGGTLTANSGALTLTRGIAGTLKVNGAAVTLTQNEANGTTANAITVSAGTVTVNNGTVNAPVTVSGGTFSSKGNISGAVTINGGTANITNGTVSAPIAVSRGAFNLNAGSATNTIAVSGGMFSSKGNISGAVTVSGGTADIIGGAVSSPINISGGTFTLSAGKLENTVIISGGTFNLKGGTANGAVTLNNGGTLSVTNNATPPASLTINGGTYKNDSVQLYKTEVTLLRSPAFTGSITYSYRNGAANRDGVTANVIKGKFTAYLPAGSTTITTTADGIIYTKLGATIAADDANAVTLTCDATVKPLPDITSYYTGTSFGNLPLPKNITVTLGGSGNKTAELPVVWNQTGSNYSSQSTAKQTIKGTITLPSDITMSPNNSITINVILKRSSSGGGSDKEPNHEYEFWSDILGEVENASSGETVYAYANKYDNVPSTILEKMKGKNITLEITRSSGSDIIIKGKNIKSLEAGRITYSLSQLSSLSKNQWSSKASSAPIGEPSTNEPTTAPSTTPSYTYKPPASSTASSSSSSEESAASPEIAEESSSEEEEIVIDSEPETTPTDTPTDVKPKAKLSPVSIAIIITVIAAVLSGIIACIILQRRSKHDQF